MSAALIPPLALATPDAIVARAGTATLSEHTARSLLAALPADQRAQLATDPSALAALLRDRLLEDDLYDKARQAHWDRRPDVRETADSAAHTAIARSYLASQVPPPPAPTEAEIKSAYEAQKNRLMLPRQFHLAQIFLATGKDQQPAAVAAVQQRLAALKRTLGNDPLAFSAAARRLSQDQRSAPAGGDLGWLAADMIAEPVRGIALGLPEGSVSDPIRTADGWHLVQLLATRPAAPAPLAEVHAAIGRALAEQKLQQATRAYLDAMLQRNPVRIDTDLLRRLAPAP